MCDKFLAGFRAVRAKRVRTGGRSGRVSAAGTNFHLREPHGDLHVKNTRIRHFKATGGKAFSLLLFLFRRWKKK